MDFLAGSFTKALNGVSNWFKRGDDVDQDPDISPSVSGPILHNDQLKPFQDGGPRYVIAVGSSHCSRSTADMAPHHDALLPYYYSTAPDPKVVMCPSLETSGCAGVTDEWFPEFTCSPHHADSKYKERLMMHYRGYGQPWHLLGRPLPTANVFRCVRHCDPSISGIDPTCRMRFWRAGLYITVMLTMEDQWGEDPYGEWSEEEEFNIIMFSDNRDGRGVYPDSGVSLLNRRLAEDHNWQMLKTIVRNEIDPCFGKYDEFISVIFSVDPDTELITRCGIGVVYCGRRCDDLECTVVQLLSHVNSISSAYYDNETSCEHGMCSGRNSFLTGVFESAAQRRRNSGPPELSERVPSSAGDTCRTTTSAKQHARAKGKNGELRGDDMAAGSGEDTPVVGDGTDPYGWCEASHGTGLGLENASQYSVCVKQAMSLRLGIDITPTHRLLRDAYERVRTSAKKHGVSLFRTRAPTDREPQPQPEEKQRYCPSSGCGCDQDDAFVAATSARLRGEAKWMYGMIKDMQGGGVLAPSDRTTDESQGTHMLKGRTFAKDASCHWLFWFIVVAGGWVSRIRTAVGANEPPDDSVCSRTPQKRLKYRVHDGSPSVSGIDAFLTLRKNRGSGLKCNVTVERRVARSNMKPWTSRSVQAMAGGRKFIAKRENRHSGGGTSCPFVLLDRTSRRYSSLIRLGKNSTETHEECCMLLFAGDSMFCALRRFFTLDDNNREAFMEEIASMVKNICTGNSPSDLVCKYPTGTGRATPFVFVLASVSCDTTTGARNCSIIRVAYGGVTTRPEAVYYAGQRVDEMCQESSVAGIYNLRTVESVPEVGLVPFRFIMCFECGPSDCGTSKVVSCQFYAAMPLPKEEALVLGSDHEWRVPDQDSFCKALSFCGVQPPTGDCCLGLFFPIKGLRLLTAENKRRAGEYCQKFLKWFQWGNGAAHYGALRRLVPLCNCYLSDVGIRSNFFGHGMLIHFHCRPEPEREKLIVKVLSQAICDAQKFAESSLYVDIKNL